ncbi:hypothetical protein AKJ16_DCAP12132 [Drosera capensis]
MTGLMCIITFLEPGLRVNAIQQGIHIVDGVLEVNEPRLGRRLKIEDNASSWFGFGDRLSFGYEMKGWK